MKLKEQVQRFVEEGGVGPDPFAAAWRERRAQWSLFANNVSEQEIEWLRPYIFTYKRLSEMPSDAPIASLNFINGTWQPAASGEFA